jgi:hypothetical protein
MRRVKLLSCRIFRLELSLSRYNWKFDAGQCVTLSQPLTYFFWCAFKRGKKTYVTLYKVKNYQEETVFKDQDVQQKRKNKLFNLFLIDV